MSTTAQMIVRATTYLLVLLSIAAGIPKVMQMPQELGFLSSIGLTGLAVSALGVVQFAGGALLSTHRFRVVGAFMTGFAFLISSIALLVGGNIQFGLFSLLPFAVLCVVAYLDQGKHETSAAENGAATDLPHCHALCIRKARTNAPGG